MQEKYSSSIAYFWGIFTTSLGAMTLEKWALFVGIICTIGTFILNWYYKYKEHKRKEAVIYGKTPT